ncbi:SDR family NAD(P)-dependent oxidoreductase [Selenomonas ruminantium]|uniref:NAD(P)-dependent dehydrogenase, short-chain alcohol dehydrogenase family n=1 Tax=Selenomonas ruminantium TaxID=971 RepID=A0A1H3XAT3_SELRU|nr:SDR family NAD(P)-dependent oxidoreductase [Selenomonas ruminantium]SDZ96340.1 NAD(P)-dependent dehydrogenase, short-chain alcohol dehydrogenase family [Selenomonas ruminantium]
MHDKRILISGGTSGIGLAAAKLFLQAGAKVALMGRSEQRGKTALQELEAGDRAIFVQGDVSRLADCRQALQQVIEKWAGLDVLVNSAGIYVEGAIEDMTEEEIARVLDINVKGTYYLSQAAVPYLKESRGNLVNVASDAGVHGNYYCSLYCASKGAVVMFTKALALELAGFGVRVNAIAPGDILTPLTEAQLQASPNREDALREMASVYPLGRIGTAEEAAASIKFLASPEAAFITGTILTVDGGLTA